MRIRRAACLLPLIWSALSLAAPAPPQHIGPTTPRDLLLQALQASEFVLTGTIVDPGGSNVRSLPPSPETAVMRITSIVQGSPDQRIISPTDDVTLIFPRREALTAGAQILVFARTFIVGERVALSVLQSTDPNASTSLPQLTARIPGLVRSRESDALRERLQSAEVVVLGEVSSRFDSADEFDIYQEHHPQLEAVIIEVREQLSGPTVRLPLIVRYATARDKSWKGAPRLVPDSTPRIFLLRLVEPYAESRLQLGGSVVPVYTLLDSADLLPASDIDRVRRALAPGPP